jgi:ribosomal protein S18 acetylase RimI-like enzyme
MKEATTRVHRVYLELASRDQFIEPARRADTTLERLDRSDTSGYRALYSEVGGDWNWVDRRGWSDERIAAHLARGEISVWLLRQASDGATAGYFELESHGVGDVEISYFGLRPAYFGQRLGGELLARAVETATELGARRIWLHTCSLDSPHALPNYRARGFRPFREEWYDAVTGRDGAAVSGITGRSE